MNERNLPQLLSSKETYEIYEKKKALSANSLPEPVTYEYRISQNFYDPRPPFITECTFQERPRRKLPFGAIIAAAVGIPLFIIVCLFLAVWFQELGFI